MMEKPIEGVFSMCGISESPPVCLLRYLYLALEKSRIAHRRVEGLGRCGDLTCNRFIINTTKGTIGVNYCKNKWRLQLLNQQMHL